jgi:hypothetical protein
MFGVNLTAFFRGPSGYKPPQLKPNSAREKERRRHKTVSARGAPFTRATIQPRRLPGFSRLYYLGMTNAPWCRETLMCTRHQAIPMFLVNEQNYTYTGVVTICLDGLCLQRQV